jgi:hypothetical protein
MGLPPPKEEGAGAVATDEKESEPRADDDGVVGAAETPSAGDVEDEDEDDEVKRIRARTRFLYHLKKSGLDEDDDECADEVERRRREEGDDEGGGASAVFRRATATTAAPDDYDHDYRFWDDEMEGMLELRIANPVWDDDTDDDEEERGDSRKAEGRVDRSTMTNPIPWSGRIAEGERGFEIRLS